MCENEYTNENPQVKWEICKIKIKETTQIFGKKKKACQSSKEIQEIEKKLSDLEEEINGENSNTLKIIQKPNHALNITIVRNVKELA